MLRPENIENATIIEERITRSNGETIVRKYAKGRLLGKGGFAKCYEVTNLESKRILAAKIIEKASLKKSRARQKVKNCFMRHENLKIFNSSFLKSKSTSPIFSKL